MNNQEMEFKKKHTTTFSLLCDPSEWRSRCCFGDKSLPEVGRQTCCRPWRLHWERKIKVRLLSSGCWSKQAARFWDCLFSTVEKFHLRNARVSFFVSTITRCEVSNPTHTMPPTRVHLIVGVINFCQSWRLWISETFHIWRQPPALCLHGFCTSAQWLKVNPNNWIF